MKMSMMKLAIVFAGGCIAGAMLVIAAVVCFGRSGSMGGEVLILPLICLLLYIGYEAGHLLDETFGTRHSEGYVKKQH